MEFTVTDTIRYPLEKVYAAMRDNLPELAAFYSNIERITLESRDEKGPIVHQVAQWEAKAKLPGPLEKLVPLNGRRWKDVATWDAGAHTVEWRITVPVFTEAVSVSGLNRFAADGANTRMTINGRIVIDPKKLTGIPTILAKQFVPTIEKFVVSSVQKNLVEGNRGLERFLAGRA